MKTIRRLSCGRRKERELKHDSECTLAYAMILDHVLILHNSKQSNIKMVKISHTTLKASGNDLYNCTLCGGTTI